MKDECCINYSSKLLDIWRQRCHKKLDYAHVGMELKAVQNDLRYWEGFNAGLEWARRIVDGDKSAD